MILNARPSRIRARKTFRRRARSMTGGDGSSSVHSRQRNTFEVGQYRGGLRGERPAAVDGGKDGAGACSALAPGPASFASRRLRWTVTGLPKTLMLKMTSACWWSRKRPLSRTSVSVVHHRAPGVSCAAWPPSVAPDSSPRRRRRLRSVTPPHVLRDHAEYMRSGLRRDQSRSPRPRQESCPTR